ncbi:hypothetical protein ACK3SF_00630 [Candidatus Nanosalina sp. VS9-1]|uniref:hypothetical protein n=1 Tax=Candidatus Nanosalina sp. VS9-1 TaxID=3388566 RepID=UPI0039E199C7
MPGEIHRKLEDIPEDVKTVFRLAQTRQEAENIEDGDHIALYNSDSNGRNEHRWIKMGVYDEIEDEVRVEYLLNYETASERLGAQMNFSTRTPGEYGSRPVKIPEEVYEKASDSLHDAF